MADVSIPQDLAIGLSVKGKEALEVLTEELPQLSESELYFVLFLVFGDKGELIDHTNTDLKALEFFLDDLLTSGTIRLPYIYQRILYNKVFDLFDQPDKLQPPEVIQLFDGVPQGIYQFGQYVAGPLGLFISKERRFIAYTQRLKLWHCSSVSCGAFHDSTLIPPSVQMKRWESRAEYVLSQKFGTSTSDGDLTYELTDPKTRYDDFWASDLHGLLGNAFSWKELRLIAGCVQEKFGKSFGKFEVNRRLTERLVKHSSTNPAQAAAADLQLCLLAADSEIKQCLDELILSRMIQIPESEIRTAMVDPPYSWQRSRCQCSSLGIRVVGGHSAMTPLARLRRLVLEIYQDEKLDDLLWMLRKHQGNGIGEKLERFIDTEDPLVVLQKFVLDSPTKLKNSLAHIRAPYLKLPEGDVEEAKLLEIICWKLGFPQKRFGSRVGIFRARLELFKKGAFSTFPTEEEWREHVRSVGVNLFVSLEEVLESSLAFTSWLLFSDHVSEKHLYNSRKGKLIAENEISGITTTEKGPIEFKASGKNTLFPLIMGFSALVKRIEQLLTEGAQVYERPLTHFPFWSSESTLQIFPFRHKYFLFDMETGDRQRLIELLGKTSSKLINSTILHVRNNVPHLSDLFPTREQIRDCCQTLEDVINDLETFGLLSVVFATESIKADLWQHQRVRSVDYKGRAVDWTSSAAITCLHDLPNLRNPQIIVPGLRVPGTAEPLRIAVQEDSSFSSLWNDYPKRKIADGVDLIAE